MKNNIVKFYTINIIIFFITVFIITFLIGLSINLINTTFSYSLLKISLINSFFISLGSVLNIFIVKKFYNKINTVILFFLSFFLVFGIFITGVFSSFIFASLIFLFESKTIYLYFIVNILFTITVSTTTTGFMIYQNKIQFMENIISQEKKLREDIEKELYSSKINPHFLFNSLNLILNLLNKPKKAEDALLCLSELLRYNLDTYKKDKIQIDEELNSVKKYLYIQKLRFDRRLVYNISCKVKGLLPPMVIQPLVENSIKHNIDNVKKLVININVYTNKNKLYINIIDSCKKLNYNMIGKGIGLENTKRRVELSGGNFYIKNGGIIIKYKL